MDLAFSLAWHVAQRRFARGRFPHAGFHSRRWRQEEQALWAFLAAQSDESLQRSMNYADTKGTPFARPLWKLMLHVVNHGTQHRSEAPPCSPSWGIRRAAWT